MDFGSPYDTGIKKQNFQLAKQYWLEIFRHNFRNSRQESINIGLCKIFWVFTNEKHGKKGVTLESSDNIHCESSSRWISISANWFVD
jgi:hypothetical protein